jgi:hypothetical protein
MAYFGTTTPLGANGTVTLGPANTDRADYISGSVFADQAGTIYIEQSGDGVNWDISSDYPVTASDGKGFSEALFSPYVRIRYVNGGSAQGAFRITSRFTSAGAGT